jgi:hypothetical protein
MLLVRYDDFVQGYEREDCLNEFVKCLLLCRKVLSMIMIFDSLLRPSVLVLFLHLLRYRQVFLSYSFIVLLLLLFFVGVFFVLSKWVHVI